MESILRRHFDDALVALSRLDAVTVLLSNAGLLFEIHEEPGVPINDAWR
jgi:hypothetical protein